MRTIIQRVSQAQVEIGNKIVASQNSGFLILLGITHSDETKDIIWLTRKITGMRVFEDEAGKMNHSIKDTGGDIIVVSQFTLFASTKKGNRPSFLDAAKPEKAEPLYQEFCQKLSTSLGKPVKTGHFGAMMEITLTNSGPVTISLDSQNPE